MSRSNNNKGLTLVELVVVIGIMAVLLVVMGVSFNTIFVNKTKSGAKNIYNMLGTAQTLGMSKGNIYLGLSADADGNTTVSVIYGGKTGKDFSVVESKKLGSKVSVDVIIKTGTNSNRTTISSTNQIMVGINRTTGGFNSVYKYRDTTGELGDALGAELTDIIVGTYDIALVKLTGKYFYR